ncbi:hypothetical protein KIN20_004946 [Parelaphostrongylus tenuis]|uniref:Uncharacterized protein n=1 Tax=Parelaphostrongylus tenuis TaxID=148309 RepID=A0AAD5M1C4_PARTN|nr:hypothetical protein KIN20_004946 [Parelaphostrongylus tenuis]
MNNPWHRASYDAKWEDADRTKKKKKNSGRADDDGELGGDQERLLGGGEGLLGGGGGDQESLLLASSDDIVKDLLNDVRQSEKVLYSWRHGLVGKSHPVGKRRRDVAWPINAGPHKPFSVEDLTAAKKAAKEKKKSKEHKHHKKSKKKKKHHRSKRHRSGSRKRSRSRSPSRKKHRKRARLRSKSRSSTRSPSPINVGVEKAEVVEQQQQQDKPDAVDVLPPAKSPPIPDRSTIHDCERDLPISDDDDLPVGADFRTVMKEAKLKINISSKIGSSLDLAALPVVPPLGKPPSINAFPLSKPVKKDEDEVMQPSSIKRESDILNKVIAEKGRGDFIPRNLKVKHANSENPVSQNQVRCDNSKKPESKLPDKAKDESFVEISADEDEKNAEFAPSVPPQRTLSPIASATVAPPAPEPVSDGELEKEIAEELAAAAQPKSSAKFSRVSKVVESSSAVISKSVTKEKNSKKTT